MNSIHVIVANDAMFMWPLPHSILVNVYICSYCQQGN